MKRSVARFSVLVCVFGLVACGKDAATPVSPSSAAQSSTAANADGSTLKATPPVAMAPPNGQQLPIGASGVTLVVGNAASKNNVGIPASYRFQIFDANNQIVEQSGNVVAGDGQTSYTVAARLNPDQTYSWWARAEVNGGEFVGSWSDRWSFVAPRNEGYNISGELYDPLINGRTVGATSGPVTWMPGRGIKLESQLSYVTYVLPTTIFEGEFSLLVTDMPTNTDGDKTKLFAMGEPGDIVTNDRRMTVEKRGDPAGVVAWRFITHGDQIDTVGGERRRVEFNPSRSYFWRATWRNSFFSVQVREDGVDGRVIYNFGKPFKGRAYDPNPHLAYLGAPVGRSGPNGASVDHVTIRQVWISGNPRPAFANQ